MSESRVTVRSDEIGLRELVLSLWAGKWWVVLGAVLMTTVFGTIAFLTTPVYRAATVLVPVSPEGLGAGGAGSALGSLSGVASMIGIGGLDGGASNTDESIAVMTSRQFIHQFVQDKSLLPVLFADDWDAVAGRWRVPEKAPTLESGYQVFVKDVLAVSEDARTRLVTVSVDWTDRQVAADWANEVVERLNSEMRRRSLTQAEASLEYLKEELARTNQIGIQEAINRLIEGQINKRMLANVTKEYSFRVADRAMAPDEFDVLRPRKTLLLAVGFILGSVLGGIAVLMASVIRRRV